MQAVRVDMNEDNIMNCSMFSSCDQDPRTLDKLYDYSDTILDTKDMISEYYRK